MPVVQMPNGDRVQFPDDMPPEQIRALIATKFPEVAQRNAAQQSIESGFGRIPGLEWVADFPNAMGDAVLGNFGDEVISAIGATGQTIGDAVTGQPLDWGRHWQENQAQAQAATDLRAERSPVATTAGQVAGALALGGTAANAGATLMNGARSIPGLIGRGALEGAGYGALYGAGSARGDLNDRIAGAEEGALWGAPLGAIGAGVAGGIGALARNAAPMPRTINQLRSITDTTRTAVARSGATIAQPTFSNWVSGIERQMASEGVRPGVFPRVNAVLRELDNIRGRDFNMTDVKALRVLMQDAADEVDQIGRPTQQARLGTILLDELDTLIMKELPREGRLLRAGNRAYSQARKAMTLERLVTVAQNNAGVNHTQAGLDQALRQQFKLLLNSRDQLRGFTADEVAAIRRIAHGSGTLHSIIRWIGKRSPNGVIGTGLHLGVGSAATLATGNPILGAGIGLGTAVGTAGAQRLSRIMTEGNVRDAMRTVLSGGRRPIPPLPIVPPSMLTAPGGQQGQAMPTRTQSLLRNFF